MYLSSAHFDALLGAHVKCKTLKVSTKCVVTCKKSFTVDTESVLLTGFVLWFTFSTLFIFVHSLNIGFNY